MSKIVKKAEDKIDELYSCNIFLTNKCKEFLKRNAENELKLNILSKASKEKIEKLETLVDLEKNQDSLKSMSDLNKMFESYQKEVMKGLEESGINDFVKSVIGE